MPEPDRWREIAGVWANARISPLEDSWVCASDGATGLCVSVAWLLKRHGRERNTMDDRLKLFGPEPDDMWDGVGHLYPYWWEHTNEGADERVLACLLLAAIAEDDDA